MESVDSMFAQGYFTAFATLGICVFLLALGFWAESWLADLKGNRLSAWDLVPILVIAAILFGISAFGVYVAGA